MKRIILAAVLIIVITQSFAIAEPGKLSGAIGVDYTTKYIWRGFDVYNDKSAIHPFIDLEFGDSGFGINLTAHRANSSGHENSERWDYNLYYRNAAFAGERYQINYMFDYVYYNYPDMSSHTTKSIDLQEINGVFSFPQILGVKGLVPTYVLVKLWPSNSGTVVGANSPSGGTASGWAHIFMLDYGMPITCPVTNEERTLNLHTEFVYNDGVGPNGANVDHDWSNVVVGLSTDLKLAENLVFTPGIYHQIIMDKSVNPDKDETWASLKVAYKF
ncbi:MAG: hypothetical protein JW804_03500 [Sedimentisphaerales bacterium]|nr:hypothetical protein [Sedimentisphaerales bacterium]